MVSGKSVQITLRLRALQNSFKIADLLEQRQRLNDVASSFTILVLFQGEVSAPLQNQCSIGIAGLIIMR